MVQLTVLILLALASPALAGPVRCTTDEEQTLGRLQTLCADGTWAVSTWNRTLERWDTIIRPPAGSGGTHGGGMARKTWWVGLLGTLALIVIASGCGPPRPWGEEYPGPWQDDPSTEDFRAIVKALSVNDIRGCGEFHYRPSAHHSNEYLVYCTRDGKVWRAYQVWPRITQVTGPQPPAVGVPPPY